MFKTRAHCKHRRCNDLIHKSWHNSGCVYFIKGVLKRKRIRISRAHFRKGSIRGLYLYISHPVHSGMTQAKKLCESPVSTVRKELQQFNVPMGYRTMSLAQSPPPPVAAGAAAGGAYTCKVHYVAVGNRQLLCPSCNDIHTQLVQSRAVPAMNNK